MSNRLLREGFIYSSAVNDVPPEAEMLFLRLLCVADDFGLFEARPDQVRARALSMRAAIDVDAVGYYLEELERVGLIRRYEVEGRLLGCIMRWEQRRNSKFPKYPKPPWGEQHIRGGYIAPRARANGEDPSHEIGSHPPGGSPDEPPAPKSQAPTKGNPRRRTAPSEAPSFEPPEWVPRDAWDAWLKVRKAKRAPNSEHALKLAVATLTNLRSLGHEPKAVLEQSYLAGWTGLFPPRTARRAADARGPGGVAI